MESKIIVSFTSWLGRKNMIANAIKGMLKQTLKPYKIVLNLSLEEFKGNYADLPLIYGRNYPKR